MLNSLVDQQHVRLEESLKKERQITSFKVPFRDGDLDDIVGKKKEKEATEELPKPLVPQHAAAPSSHLISLLPVLPILSQPAVPLIATL